MSQKIFFNHIYKNKRLRVKHGSKCETRAFKFVDVVNCEKNLVCLTLFFHTLIPKLKCQKCRRAVSQIKSNINAKKMKVLYFITFISKLFQNNYLYCIPRSFNKNNCKNWIFRIYFSRQPQLRTHDLTLRCTPPLQLGLTSTLTARLHPFHIYHLILPLVVPALAIRLHPLTVNSKFPPLRMRINDFRRNTQNFKEWPQKGVFSPFLGLTSNLG